MDNSTYTPINELWKEFKQACNECLQQVPILSPNNSRKPWITNIINRLSRQKQCHFNKAHQTNHSDDWNAYYKLKKKTQQERRRSHNHYVSNLTHDRGNVSKKLWSYIKSKRKDTFGIPLLLLHDGSTYSDSLAKTNIFNNYFASIFTEEDCSTIPTHGSQPLSNISPLTISVEGVAHLLQKIDPNKTGGPDGIPARFLKELSLEIAPVLTLIHETSINQGTLPDDWLKARAIPIYKRILFLAFKLSPGISNLPMLQNFRTCFVFTYYDSPLEQ